MNEAFSNTIANYNPEGLLVDTGALSLYLAAKDPDASSGDFWGQKQLSFGPKQECAIEQLVEHFKHALWTTPHVLVETLRGVRKSPNLRQSLFSFACDATEMHIAARDLCYEDYQQFGLSDAAILELAIRNNLGILSKDQDLVIKAGSMRVAAFNVYWLV